MPSKVGYPPYRGIEEVSYMFIDGNYFYHVLKDVIVGFLGSETMLKLNLPQLTYNFTKVFYYDTIPAKKKSQTEEEFNKLKLEKELFFDELRHLDGYHVYEGITRIRRKRQMQKGVDTMISIDMLRHTFRKNMHKAALIAGDLDFLPLLDALVMEGMFTTLWYSSNSISTDLLNSTDSVKRIKIAQVHQLLSKEDKLRFPIPKMLTTKINIDEKDELIKSGSINNFEIDIYKVGENYKAISNKRSNGIGTESTYTDVDKLTFYLEDFYGSKIIWNN